MLTLFVPGYLELRYAPGGGAILAPSYDLGSLWFDFQKVRLYGFPRC